MAAYATQEQALLQWPGAAKPTGDDLARIVALLPVAAAQLDRAAQRDWYRHPETDTASWLETGDGSRVLHVHGGIVSLTKVEVRYSRGLDWQEVDADGWVLRGTDPGSDKPDVAGLPSFHVYLTGETEHHRWPEEVRLTGVRGYDTPPVDLVQANIERARQLFSADATYSGGVIATDGLGNPVSTFPALPASFWAFLKAENSRFAACHL